MAGSRLEPLALPEGERRTLENWVTARPFKWTKTADQIIDRICRYCDRISRPAH